MNAVTVELLTRPPATGEPAGQPVPDPDAIEVVADTDKLMTMCACSASSDNPY